MENKPTQVQYPWRATVRTAFQTAVTVLSLLAIILPAIHAEYGDSLPPRINLWLTGVCATIVSCSALVARIMADPRVNILLSRLGLAAEPRNKP